VPPPPRRPSGTLQKPGGSVRVVPPPIAAGSATSTPKPEARPQPKSIPPPLPASPPPPVVAPAHLKTDAGLGATPAASETPLWAQQVLRKLEAELGRERDPLRVGRLHYEVARLYESPVGDLTNAADHYQKAYATCPDHLPTLRGARRVLTAKKSFGAALPLFDAEARYLSEPGLKAQLFYEKGRILEDHLAQKREARDAYAAAVELDGQNAAYLKALERVDAQAKSWDALEKTLERAANVVSSDARHRAALIVERARLVEARKGDSRTATELYNEALGFDPRAPGALEALKRLHYAHQRWRDLTFVLQREAEQSSDPEVRAMAFYRMGRVLCDRLGHQDEGQSAFERALSEVPGDPMVLGELARLYETTKRWDALADVLERLAELAPSPSQKLGVMHRIGQIAEERLDDEARAISWFSRALGLDPTYLPALQALGSLHTRRQEWAELIAMHLGEAGATADATRAASAEARVAAIYEERLGNLEHAVAHHMKALGLHPGYAPSFKALSRIYQEAGKWRELVELFERAVDEAKDAETKITFLFKIGRAWEDALGSPAHAVGAYKRVLEVAPNHVGAIHAVQRAAERAGRFQELVWALELEDRLHDLEGALARYRRVVELDKTFQPGLSSLGRLYYQAGRWEDLLDTYKRELEVAAKGAPTAALLYKMGELSEERIGREDDAIGYYRRALDADAFHHAALHALARKLSERGQWGELVKLIELELSGLTEPAERARAAFHLGEVYENKLAQPDRALLAYEQALLAVPEFRPASDGRARLLTLNKEYRKLAEDLSREIGAAKDPVVAMLALFRQGEVYRDELGEVNRAIEAFEAVLSRDPSHLGALLALEPLYVEAGAWDSLARVYATEARVLSDVGARVAALKELARLQEVRGVGRPEELRAAYIAVLQLSPSDPGALAALERVALSSKDTQLLTHVDAKLGATLGTPALAAVHQTRLAEALEALGDPSALETFRAALARDRDNLAAALGVVRIAERGDDPGLLGEAAELSFRVLLDKPRGAELLVRASQALIARSDVEGAVMALEAALEKHPDDAEAARELRRLLLGRREVDRLFDALCQAAQWARDGERMAALWLDVSEVLADEKKDVPAAIAALHRTLERLPRHIPTLMRLADLYARDKQYAEAVDRLKQTLAASPPPETEVAAHLMLSRLLKDHLGDEARALGSLERVLAIDARNREALSRVLEIQMRRGQMNEAANTAAELVAVAASNKERADTLGLLARLNRQNKNLDAAANAYEQAVSMVGTEGTVAAEFKDLLLEQKLLGEDPRWDYYVGALSGYADMQSDPRKRSAIQLEIAQVLADEMEVLDRALHTLQRALVADAENGALRTELAKRLRQAGHFPQALIELRRLLESDVTKIETWSSILACFQGMQKKEEAELTMAPLVALGFASDLERATISSRVPRCAHARPGSFDETAFRGVDARGSDPAVGVLGAISEGLGKVFPPELDRYGLGSRDRITSRTGHPTKQLADRVAAVFGPLEFDIYLHRAHQGGLEVELTDPPAILVPAHVTALKESEQVFLFARPLALMARGAHAILRLAPAELGLLLISACRQLDPSFGAGVSDEDFLQQQQKRVQKSLSRKNRRTLEEVAPAFMSAPRPDPDQWVFEHRKVAARAAALLADDLPASIALIRRMEGDLAGLRGTPLAQGIALTHDVLRFWVSDAAFALRRRIGLL
jgi:tetratricopeptide (TPR) repeat protein